MSRRLVLTSTEQELRCILLDVADYIGSQNGYARPELRFTGGWVRDKLLGVTSHDIDVGISSLTGERFGVMMKQYLEDPETQARHPTRSLGTLAVIRENPGRSKHLETAKTKICGIEVDLVNLRKETYTEESRNPVVEFGTPEEDASRRDSTVNALFYNLSSDRVEDPTGQGLRDMDLKIIRTPMDPFTTFKDDPLRVLRCIRFASRLGYTIDAAALQSMGHPAILDALHLKISRERVGDEVSKMLKGGPLRNPPQAEDFTDLRSTGPDPLQALSLIHTLGLYDTVFTGPSQSQSEKTDVSNWRRVYSFYSRLIKGEEPQMETFRSVVLADESDAYLGWLMAAVIPLAGRPRESKGTRPKSAVTGPAAIVREGLKLDNASTQIVNDACEHLSTIRSLKQDFLKGTAAPSLSQSRPIERDLHRREETGMAIRTWNSRKSAKWKLSVLFALLTELFEAKNANNPTIATSAHDNDSAHPEDRDILIGYVDWLLSLKTMDLLDVHKMAPIMNGKKIMEAAKRESGPWVNEALEDVLRWQLRNPNVHCAKEAERLVEAKYHKN